MVMMKIVVAWKKKDDGDGNVVLLFAEISLFLFVGEEEVDEEEEGEKKEEGEKEGKKRWRL